MHSKLTVLLLFLSAFVMPLAAAAQEPETSKYPDDFDTIVESVINIRDAAAKNKNDAPDRESFNIAGIKVIDLTSDTISAPESKFSKMWNETLVLTDSVQMSNTVRDDNENNRSRVTTRRFHVAKGGLAKLTLPASKKLSVAAVPQDGGLVTLRLHAHNRHGYDEHFDDTVKFQKGMNYRKQKIKLPDRPTKVDIEVLNRSPKAIDCILIIK